MNKSALMKSRTLTRITAITLFAGAVTLLISVRLFAQESQERASKVQRPIIITFDAPGAGTVSSPACAPFCGTFGNAENSQGAIVGFYTDTNIVPHGFLRTPHGHIISFYAPGSG
jgi:hypothetical protein